MQFQEMTQDTLRANSACLIDMRRESTAPATYTGQRPRGPRSDASALPRVYVVIWLIGQRVPSVDRPWRFTAAASLTTRRPRARDPAFDFQSFLMFFMPFLCTTHAYTEQISWPNMKLVQFLLKLKVLRLDRSLAFQSVDVTHIAVIGLIRPLSHCPPTKGFI